MLWTIAIIAGVVLLLLALLLGYASTKPNEMRIQRSLSMNAPPEKIYPHLIDFRKWADWSPWEKLDPNLKRTHSGAASGPGAIYAWEGNKKVGQGRMEIATATPSSKVVIKLDFLKPFEAHNICEFDLQPAGSATNFIWTMHGPNQFMGKVMSVFLDMDKLIGKDFEAGLANLKGIVEK